MEIVDIKQEPLEGLERSSTIVHKGEKRVQKTHDGKKQVKLKIEETILKLYEELDREKYENPMMDFSQRRSLRIREVVDNLELCEKIEELESMNNQMAIEIVSLKAELQMAQNYFANIDSITKELKSKWKSKDRNQSNKPFLCRYCNESFDQIRLVKEHVENHHLPISDRKSEDQLDNSKTEPKEGIQKTKQISKDTQKSETFADKEILNLHVVVHDSSKKRKKAFQSCETTTEPKKNKEIQKVVIKSHSCIVCNKFFTRKDTLNSHINQIHEGTKPFHCDYFNTDFAQKIHLKRHLVRKHKNCKMLKKFD